MSTSWNPLSGALGWSLLYAAGVAYNLWPSTSEPEAPQAASAARIERAVRRTRLLEPGGGQLVNLAGRAVKTNPARTPTGPFALSLAAFRLGQASTEPEFAAGGDDGFFSNAYTSAKSGFENTKHAWSSISYTQLGAGLGVLGLAYLAYKYWKGSGVNITNNNTFNPTVNVNIQPAPGTKIVHKKSGDQTEISVQSPNNGRMMRKMDELIKILRSQNARL